MSEMIRKITGIGASTNVNYIPVVYYCICDTDANDNNKIAKWIGNSNGTAVTNEKLELYNGIIIAIKFTKGINKLDAITNDRIKLKITNGNNQDFKNIIIWEDSDPEKGHFRGCEKDSVILFTYDKTADNFKVVDGIDNYAVDDLKEWVESELTSIQNDFVHLPETDNPEEHANVGSGINPIFVENKYATPSTATVGQNTANAIKPIWLNQGSMATFTVNSGATNRPVYVGNGVIAPITASKGSSSNPVYFQNGTIKEATEDFGSDVKPLKMAGGKLTPVANNLATQTALATEKARAMEAEEALQSAVDSAAHDIKLTSDNSDYKYTFQLKDKNGNLIGSSITINLPLETMVTSGTYSNGVISLILQNGNSITFPVVDLQNGLVKDSGSNGEGDDAHPIYVNNNGVATSTSYDLSTFATSGHKHAASDITSGILGVVRGGTGLSTNPSLLTNLGSTTATTVFQVSPRPGITGTLGLSHGGTGATTAAGARTSLGLGTAATYASTTFAPASHSHAWGEITGAPTNSTLNYYHTAGTYKVAASGATSGLVSTIGGSGVGSITINVPIYWGTSTPTLTGITGAIYIQI